MSRDDRAHDSWHVGRLEGAHPGAAQMGALPVRAGSGDAGQDGHPPPRRLQEALPGGLRCHGGPFCMLWLFEGLQCRLATRAWVHESGVCWRR